MSTAPLGSELPRRGPSTDPMKFYAAIAGRTPTIGPPPPAAKWSNAWMAERCQAAERAMITHWQKVATLDWSTVRQRLLTRVDDAFMAAARAVRSAALRLTR